MGEMLFAPVDLSHLTDVFDYWEKRGVNMSPDQATKHTTCADLPWDARKLDELHQDRDHTAPKKCGQPVGQPCRPRARKNVFPQVRASGASGTASAPAHSLRRARAGSTPDLKCHGLPPLSDRRVKGRGHDVMT